MAREECERCEADRKDWRVEETIGVSRRIDRGAVKYAMPRAIVNVEVALRAKGCRDAEPDEVGSQRDPCELAGARRVDLFHRGRLAARGGEVTRSAWLPRSA